MEHYKNLDLTDIEGEEWVDAIGYDGHYEVSNFGRVKSIGRFVNGSRGNQRWVNEKILKQALTKDGNLIIALSGNNTRTSKQMIRFVFDSFNPNEIFKDKDCVMHLNKVLTDNRLSNLKKTVRKTSKGVDMTKSKKTIKATPKNLKKAVISSKEYYENRTHETCKICLEEKELKKFPKEKLTCKKCANKRAVERRNNFKPTLLKRTCSACNTEKDISFFYKNKTWCRPCTNQYMKDRRNT